MWRTQRSRVSEAESLTVVLAVVLMLRPACVGRNMFATILMHAWGVRDAYTGSYAHAWCSCKSACLQLSASWIRCRFG